MGFSAGRLMSLSKEERLEIAAKCLEDPLLFCKTFLPHLFPKEIPWVHRGLWAILTRQTEFLKKYGELDKIFSNFVVQRTKKDTPRPVFVWKDDKILLDIERYTEIMLPRGFSKTTLAGVAATLRGIAYLDWNFLVYVSETLGHATMQLTNVKRELETNLKFQAVFGELVPSNSSPLKWTNDLAELTNGQIIAARGRGGQIRGLNHRGNRPDRIIVDDVEDKESVSTDEQRKKTRQWAFGDLMPALPEMNPDAQMIALGTLLHQDALLVSWAKDPQWLPIIFGAYDKQGELLWKENLDEKKLQAKKESYTLVGEINLFWMEYHNQIRDDATALFQQKYFKHAEEPPRLRKGIYIDPAIGEDATADEAAIYVVGMSENGYIYVCENWSKRNAEPRELIDQYFDMAKRHEIDSRCHGIEANGFQAALIHLLREEMFRKKYYFEPIKVTHKTKKFMRIKGMLQPRYAGGYIYHSCNCTKLESQLLDFPNGKYDDHADAMAGAVALLDPLASFAIGDGEDPAKDEYPPLEEELGEWRCQEI